MSLFKALCYIHTDRTSAKGMRQTSAPFIKKKTDLTFIKQPCSSAVTFWGHFFESSKKMTNNDGTLIERPAWFILILFNTSRMFHTSTKALWIKWIQHCTTSSHYFFIRVAETVFKEWATPVVINRRHAKIQNFPETIWHLVKMTL